MQSVNKSIGTDFGHGLHLRWANLCYDVQVKDEERSTYFSTVTKAKRVLHSVNGQVGPGQMLALMGPSGSGKTSLVNILGGHKVSGISGDILVNGNPRDHQFKKYCGYVTQHGTFLDSLTVRETLHYTARLRLPDVMSEADKKARVEELIHLLDLEKCANSRIGNQLIGGISGGEQRRLSIAMEIVHHPKLLILDEPTSGLDATTAQLVISTLKKLASRGTTVICTIHQPRASLLPLFDQIMLLAEGRTIYYGPSFGGSTQDSMLNYFAEAGYHCPIYENPADFILDLINTREKEKKPIGVAKVIDVEKSTGEVVAPFEDRKKTIEILTKRYQDSELSKTMMESWERMPNLYNKEESLQQNKYPTSWWTQFLVLFQRAFFYKLREPSAVLTQGFNSMFMPIIIGSIYWQMSLSQTAIQDRVASLSFTVVMQAFMAIDQLLLFPKERAVYLKDQASGMYCTSSFYIGRSLAETPFHIIFALFAATISYWMFGFQNDLTKYLNYLAIIVAVTQAGVSLLVAIGSLCKTLEQSNMLGTVFLMLFMIFDGFYVNKQNIPSYYRWIEKMSFMGYGVESATANEFRGLKFECSEEDQVIGCIPDGEAALERLGMNDVDIMFNVVIMLLMSLAYRAVGYFGLRFTWTGQTLQERLKM